MKQINSSLPGTRATFGYFREALQPHFTLSNWDYEQGYFDRALDDKNMVFLRLPVKVLQGELDSPDAWLEMGQPFVIRHVYQTGVEEDIGYMEPLASGLVNQFQEPVDKDAQIDSRWIRKAEAVVKELENRLA
ncbi:YugN-like family protein [Brevibacillus sp. 179-C9.3 HS]|uniref:YugN-like family protein n=1 Tax=unclassified Brevibacillus TaxID=2684853 RepID=UPI0039A2519F